MTDIQAVLGVNQLSRLRGFIEQSCRAGSGHAVA
jgi:dTDP-4-amino-4,6-dideoxygalactose transaminase